MATNQHNNYQDIQPGAEGEGNEAAPPPAFNPEAVNPSDYSSISPPTYGSIPTQIQQPISQQQYIQPQQQIIPQQIVQQSQYQPIPQQPNIQYVNQYGQPIQNVPVVVVPNPQPNSQQQTIIYSQSQSPLIPQSIHDYRNPTNKDKQKRYIAATFGILACILLVSAMSSHKLAQGSIDGYDYECQILYIHTLSNDVENDNAYYSDFCWNFDSDVHWDDWEYTTSNDWCNTWRGSSYWISCIVFGCLFSCCATCWVQPICTVDRCCCPLSCPRLFYALGLLLCILGNVLWTMNDKVCMPDDALGLNIGISIELVAGSCVVIFFTMFCAK